MDQITLKMVITACMLLIAMQTCVAITVSIDDSTIAPGGTVTVPIRISDIENYGAGTIVVNYDPAVVHVTDVVKSSDSKIADSNIDNTAGLTGIGAWNLNGVNGSIIFANVVLKAVGRGGDSSSLAITVDTLQDVSYEELKPYLSNGTFTISGSSGSAAITSTQESTGGTSSHSTPPLPDVAATETETGSRTDAKPATSDEPSDSVQSQSQSQSSAPADHSTESEPEHDRRAETPSMNTPFLSVIAVCLCLLIAYVVRRNGGAR